MHSLRFHVTESCLAELQRNKKTKWDRGMEIWGEWDTLSELNVYTTSKLFVMNYQATTDKTKYNDNQNYH